MLSIVRLEPVTLWPVVVRSREQGKQAFVIIT
jgi:hypothetical protein